MRRHVLTILVVLGLSAWFQAWFLGLLPGGRKLGDPSLSSAYTEALGHGQSYLLATPDPRVVAAKDPFGPATAGLMIWDTSYFHGHYYMYFGIVPFAVFMVPWYLVAGASPSPELAILAFSVLGYLAYGGILLLAIRRVFPKASVLLAATAFVTVIVASGTWPLMGRPAIYEIENAAAYAFFGLSLLALAGFETGKPRNRRLLWLSAGLAALVMGCRPNYFPAVSALALWILWRSRASSPQGKPRFRCTVAPLLPMIVIGCAIGFWNFHRFGSPADFGLKHTVSDDPSTLRPLSTFANLPYHVHRYAVGMPRLDRYFPFIQGQHEGPFHLGTGQEISNQVYGFLVISPVILAVIIGIPLRRRLGVLGPFCLLAAAAFLGNYLFLSSLTMSSYRYPADFWGPS